MALPSDKVLVAMSGGVDSSAAALMLVEQGYSVVGVSMQVWDYRKSGGNSSRVTCCAPSDFQDARVLSEYAGFPYYVFDFEEEFHQEVIAPFVDQYKKGITPNPCINCNRRIKFKQLRRRAKTLGIDKIATGHYAKIKSKGEKLSLYVADDLTKDQSYFLYSLTQEELRSTIFPLAGLTKHQVRNYLSSRNLTLASKEESQDICFISSTVSEFIKAHGAKEEPGVIENQEGLNLGTHGGISNYTVGQRRGLGISNPSPLYVLEIDETKNRLIVGEKEELQRESFIVEDINWISGTTPSFAFEARVKMRYRHSGIRSLVEPITDSSAMVTFLDEWSVVSPGQASVFYSIDTDVDGDTEIIGGGVISKSKSRENFCSKSSSSSLSIFK